MTRKDYVKIAEAISKTETDPTYIVPESEMIWKGDVIDSLCKMLKQDNPRFDEKKFRAACEK